MRILLFLILFSCTSQKESYNKLVLDVTFKSLYKRNKVSLSIGILHFDENSRVHYHHRLTDGFGYVVVDIYLVFEKDEYNRVYLVDEYKKSTIYSHKLSEAYKLYGVEDVKRVISKLGNGYSNDTKRLVISGLWEDYEFKLGDKDVDNLIFRLRSNQILVL